MACFPSGRARAGTWVLHPPQQAAQGHFFIPGAESSRGGYVTQAASSSIGITLHSSEMQNLGLPPTHSVRLCTKPPTPSLRLQRGSHAHVCAVWSGLSRWQFSRSFRTRACFTHTLCTRLSFLCTCPRPQLVIVLIKGAVRGVPFCWFPW